MNTIALVKVLTIFLWVKIPFFQNNDDLLAKKCWDQQIKSALVLKGVFYETAYLCVLT